MTTISTPPSDSESEFELPIQPSSSSSPLKVHTSLLFDPKSKQFKRNVSIVVDPSKGLITDVYTRRSKLPNGVPQPDIDLRGKTVIPGLVDAHTHIFLHAYTETPALNQMRDESPVERILRATNHVRSALLAGYTTYRDLGTEGLHDADTHFRDAINRGIIPGPRLFVATETIASSGGYEIRQESSPIFGGTRVTRISDPADGIDGVRAAVRRRLGAGADIVKFYADYRKRQLRYPPPAWPGAREIEFLPTPSARNPNLLLFNQDEVNAIVAEAKASGAPVAAHAGSANGVIMAARAGVTTVEHGQECTDEALKVMKECGAIFVPTLAVMELFYPRGGDFEKVLANAKKAWDMGIKVAAGGDTGAIDHGKNVRELELLVEAGVPLEDALQAATLHGWEACGGELCGRKFGWWEAGSAADIVALDGDLRGDLTALRRVDFVMKDGRVWKEDGLAVGMV